METLGLSRQPGKEIADEDIDGFDVQFQIGPLQGPLPAVPEEGRRRGAVQFRDGITAIRPMMYVFPSLVYSRPTAAGVSPSRISA